MVLSESWCHGFQYNVHHRVMSNSRRSRRYILSAINSTSLCHFQGIAPEWNRGCKGQARTITAKAPLLRAMIQGASVTRIRIRRLMKSGSPTLPRRAVTARL